MVSDRWLWHLCGYTNSQGLRTRQFRSERGPPFCVLAQRPCWDVLGFL